MQKLLFRQHQQKQKSTSPQPVAGADAAESCCNEQAKKNGK